MNEKKMNENLHLVLHAHRIKTVQESWPDHDVTEEWQIDDAVAAAQTFSRPATMILYSEDDVRRYLHQIVDRLDLGDRSTRLEFLVRHVVRVRPRSGQLPETVEDSGDAEGGDG